MEFEKEEEKRSHYSLFFFPLKNIKRLFSYFKSLLIMNNNFLVFHSFLTDAILKPCSNNCLNHLWYDDLYVKSLKTNCMNENDL